MKNNSMPWEPYKAGQIPPVEPKRAFPAGKKEVLFALALLLSCFALCNFTLFYGFNLGFALAVAACMVSTFVYLLCAGCKPTVYSSLLLALSLAITAAFPRSNDIFVKIIMLCFLFLASNLCFCIMAKQNLRSTGSVSSLLDAPRALFALGVGRNQEALSGLGHAFRRSGSLGQKGGAFLLGLGVALPVLAVMLPLLISADAAFDGLIALLPDFDVQEFIVTLSAGPLAALLLYGRGVALRHSEKQQPKEAKSKGINAITINTALGAVCLVYVAYLLSQLAYFSGGFSGILPEEYTLAEYARRGFFEMATLCAINLGVIVLSLAVVRKGPRAPLATRLLCLFVGVVTLFLVATASAKMFLYIGSYGLTRLRVLTQIIMLFLALTTGFVMVWLFVPKLPYMKAVIISAMVIGAATIWTDVNTQVARYNVDAYLSGSLSQVDLDYLKSLGNSAVPQIARLAEQAPSIVVAGKARSYLKYEYKGNGCEDFRGWNYVNHSAESYISNEEAEET